MAEEGKTVETPEGKTTEIKSVVTKETKTTPAPTEAVKATPAKTDVVEDKSKPAKEAKAESKAEVKVEKNETPAEELKTLLDEASEEEVKLDKDGNPIKEAEAKALPEKYEFKLPEGVTLDEAALKLVDPIFRELKLDNEQAQKLVDIQIALNKQNEDAHTKAFDQYVEDLKVEAKTFFGIKLPEVMRNVARARDQFIHKELQDKLNINGLSNDKDVLVMLDKLGRVVGEGKFVEGKRSGPAKGQIGIQTPTGKDATLEDVYPSMAKK